MAYLELGCANSGGNTGKQKCTEDFGIVEMLAIGPVNTEIATKTDAETESTWIDLFNGVKGFRFYPLFRHFNAEIEQEGRVSATGWANKTRTVRPGKTSVTYDLEDISFYNHKELRKHNNTSDLGVFRFTANGYIQGKTDDNIVFKPIPLSDFYVNDRVEANGDDIDYSQIFIEYQNFSRDWNDLGVWVKPTAFDPLALSGIKDVALSGTLGVTGMTITVLGVSDTIGALGLVDANFSLYADATPETLIPVTAVEVGAGVYTLTWADQTGTGAVSLTLTDQPAGTSGFEATNILTATL